MKAGLKATKIEDCSPQLSLQLRCNYDDVLVTELKGSDMCNFRDVCEPFPPHAHGSMHLIA